MRAYELLAAQCDYPLHLGVTEAGPAFQGTIKSAVAFGALLSQGIGDTIRVSLSAPPVEEVKVGNQILESLNLRQRGLEIVSCPSCGRAQVDVYKLAEEVTAGLEGMEVPLRVAVMGCVVNGPGEAREADLGVASGNGKGQIFVKGEVIKTVPESQIVETLIEEAMRIAAEQVARRRRRPGRPSSASADPSGRDLRAANPDRARPRRGRRGGRPPAAGHRSRWRPASWPAGSRSAGTAAGVPRRAALGHRRRARAGRGLPRRRQPDPLRRPGRRARPRPSPSPSGPAGPAAAARRSSARPASVDAAVGAARPALGAGPRPPAAPAADGHRRAAGGRARAAGAPGPARRAGDPAARPRSRCSPRRSASARSASTAGPATGRGSPSWSAPGSRWPGSRTARCSSRPRSARSPAPPARSRASGCAPATGAGASGRPARRPSSSTPEPRSPRSSASTSTTSTRPPGPPTAGSASARSGSYASVLF